MYGGRLSVVKTIEEFTNMYTKLNTIKSYRSGVFSFLDYCYGKVRQGNKATEQEKRRYDELNQQYFSEGRDYLNDLIGFVSSMSGTTPPSTIQLKLNVAKEWHRFNGIEMTQSELRTLKHKVPKAKGAWTNEKTMTKEILKTILSHTDTKSSALILTLSSSGLRIGELLQIKLSDVSLDANPPSINVRGEYTKTSERRTVFISKEAREAVCEWLKVRDEYLKASKNRNLGLIKKGNAKPKKTDDDRLFPFSDGTVRELWGNALRKSGYFERDVSTSRLTYRVHSLRKYFRSQLALGSPVDVAESLLGHSSYLSSCYRRYTAEQMGAFYLKGEHYLTVFGSGDLEEIQESLRDTQMAMNGYKQTVDGYKQDIEKKDEMIISLVEDVSDLKKKLADVDELKTVLAGLLEMYINISPPDKKTLSEMAKKLKN